MIAVDTSALVSILLQEKEARDYAQCIVSASPKLMSAATLVEAGIVMEGRRGDVGARELDLLILRLGIEVVPLTPEQAALARRAFRQFGKGRHPAKLNFGDCFSYALAADKGIPLLYKGDDFSKTDIESAIAA